MLGQLFRDSSPDNRRNLSGIPSRLQNGTSGSVLSIESNLTVERALSKIWLWKEKSWVCGIESGHKVTLVQNFCSFIISINRTIFPDTTDKIKFNDHQLLYMFASTTARLKDFSIHLMPRPGIEPTSFQLHLFKTPFKATLVTELPRPLHYNTTINDLSLNIPWQWQFGYKRS